MKKALKNLTGITVIILMAYSGCLLYLAFHSAALRNTELIQQKAELSALRERMQTLDLALEFGFDPMIVQTTQRLATQAFKAKHDSITWRFVKTDKELTYLILSVIQTESHGDIDAHNKSGASGLTQLMFSTAKQYDRDLKPAELLTLPKNLEIAVAHFVELLERYRGNHYLAVLAWNRGATGADRIAQAGVDKDAYVNAVFMQAAMRNAQ